MYLWNDYEGKILAGFPLHRLLRTEGRSGFFLTDTPEGRPAVIRLTESLNDDERMAARYRGVQNIGEPGLLSILSWGSAELDGTPLFYLLLEPSSESLADILRDRPLSAEETDEVAGVVLRALEALHGAGFVHGLVEPDSVLAAGDQIKLRSDCAQPAPQGEEPGAAEAARRADALAYVGLLHRALTQSALVDESDALRLPEPYASIVRHTLRGHWGLSEIGAELTRTHRLRAPMVPPAPASAAAPAPALEEPVRAEPVAEAIPAASPVASAPAPAQASLPLGAPSLDEAEAHPPLTTRRGTLLDEDPAATPLARKPGVWIAVAAVALLLVLALLHTRSGNKPAPVTQAVTAPPSAPAPAPSAPVPVPRAEAHPAAAPAAAASAPSPGGEVWRVVAYTYNREGEAQSKARAIASKHPELHPEVFSPRGHAPFLVTLGGGMTRPHAEAVRARARHDGLARDVYVQNYSH
jgi:eukaryotic-like serine/threonine-protein kinase